MHNFQRTSQHSLRERSSCKTKTNTAWFCWDKNDEKNRRNLVRAIQWNLGVLLWWSLLFLCLFSDSLDLKKTNKQTNKQTAIGVERNRAIFTQVWKVIRDRIGFCSTPLCDWSRKLTPLSPPMRCKIWTNFDLVARVFPRFPAFWAVWLFLLWILTGSLFFLILCWRRLIPTVPPWKPCDPPPRKTSPGDKKWLVHNSNKCSR